MPQRFLTWCLSWLGVFWMVATLGCASHQAIYYASSSLVSSGIEQARLPKVVVVVDHETFIELRYFIEDLKDAARNGPPDPRYLGQQVRLISPVIAGKENLDRLQALIEKSLQSGRVIEELEPGPDWRDHAAVQGTGGFAAGVSISVVPGGSIGAAITEQTGILPPTSNAFRVGKDIGLLVGGVGQIIVGCSGLGLGAGATTTGGGAPMGLAIGVASVDVMANGYAAVCVASNDLVHIAFHWGDDNASSTNSTAATPEKPQTAPAAPAAKPAENAAPAPAPKPATPAAKPPPAKPAQTSTTPGNRRVGTVKVSPSGTTTRTWVKCTGQWHHAISKRIFDALKRHKVLSGVYKHRDERLVTQAINKQAHNGYETWHRQMEDKVVDWLNRHEQANQAQFEEWLRNLYKSDTALAWRFPNGI